MIFLPLLKNIREKIGILVFKESLNDPSLTETTLSKIGSMRRLHQII